MVQSLQVVVIIRLVFLRAAGQSKHLVLTNLQKHLPCLADGVRLLEVVVEVIDSWLVQIGNIVKQQKILPYDDGIV